MATLIKLTYKKPNSTPWFSQTRGSVIISASLSVTPAKALMSFNTWCKSRTGFIGVVTKMNNPNNISNFYVFDTEENATNWNESRKEHPFQLAQSTYYDMNNIEVIEEML